MFNQLTSIANSRRVLLVVLILVALSPFKTVMSDMNKAETRALALKPDWSVDCLLSVRTEILARAQKVSSDPAEYFRVLDLKFLWEAAASKYMTGAWRASEGQIRNQQMLGAMAVGLTSLIQSSQRDYFQKYNAQVMSVVGENYRLAHGTKLPWQQIETEWSPGLGEQFFHAWLIVALLSFLSAFLAFWDEGNLRAFPRRLPIIIPMAFVVGPLTSRWAGADRSLVASDVWLMTSFATATIGVCMPGAAIMVKAQAPTTAKAKQSNSRTATSQTDGAENSGQGINNLLPALKRLGVSQVDAEVLPGATGTLREVAIEAAGGWSFGKNGNNGKGTFFTFVETRQKVFFNTSVAFFPWSQRTVAPTAEFGYNQTARTGFMSAGGKVVLTKAPALHRAIGKAFDFAAISYLHKVSGAAPKQQLLFVYDTRALPLNSWLKVVGSGFWRYRMRTAINYGQQTVRFQVGSWKRFEPIVQFDTAGKTVGVSAGVKLYLFSAR